MRQPLGLIEDRGCFFNKRSFKPLLGKSIIAINKSFNNMKSPKMLVLIEGRVKQGEQND